MIPVYILDDETSREFGSDRRLGGASRWWLHHALSSLEKDLRRHGSKLIMRRGSVCDVLPELAEETGARTVHAIRHYEPWWRRAQGKLKDQLDLQLHDGNYLLPPGTVTTGSGTPYKIFTPFKIRCSRYRRFRHPARTEPFPSRKLARERQAGRS